MPELLNVLPGRGYISDMHPRRLRVEELRERRRYVEVRDEYPL
jgi:hypothetical protein